MRYRFFFHYFKAKKCMSIHFRGRCYAVKNIVCEAPCESHWNTRQPMLVMRGMAANVRVLDDTAYIDLHSRQL